jgi:hypothetical protein
MRDQRPKNVRNHNADESDRSRDRDRTPDRKCCACNELYRNGEIELFHRFSFRFRKYCRRSLYMSDDRHEPC